MALARPNWFFAFPVDAAFTLALPAPPPSFRRLHPDDVHLTLSFLGGCGQADAERALAALDEQLTQAPRSSLLATLGEVVPMGPRSRYSALSALLSDGRQQTEACIGALRDALSEAALGRREARPPKAHVTLARPTGASSPQRRREGLAWAAGLDLKSISIQLERIALYTWSEQRRERLFRVVAERRLAPLVPLAPPGPNFRESAR